MRNLNVKYAKSRLFLIIVLLAFVTVTGFISARRAEKGSNDFDTFYAAGQSVYSYGNNLYYTGPYHERTSEVSPFLYSPLAAIFFSLFSWANIRTSAFFWNFFNICLFLAVLNYCTHIDNARLNDWMSTKYIFCWLYFCDYFWCMLVNGKMVELFWLIGFSS